MAKSREKNEAKEMRKEGMSIKDIATFLNISKSSASLWCREIVLSQKQKQKIYNKMIKAGHRGRIKGAEKNKKKRLERIKTHEADAKKILTHLSDRDKLMLGLGLYWGEGAKTKRVHLSNSDPVMIRLFQHILEDIFFVKRDQLVPRININEIHRDSEKDLLKFWSSLLELPERQFKKTRFIPVQNKKIYSNYNEHFGTLSLKVEKSTDLNYKIIAFINRLKDLDRLPT